MRVLQLEDGFNKIVMKIETLERALELKKAIEEDEINLGKLKIINEQRNIIPFRIVGTADCVDVPYMLLAGVITKLIKETQDNIYLNKGRLERL